MFKLPIFIFALCLAEALAVPAIMRPTSTMKPLTTRKPVTTVKPVILGKPVAILESMQENNEDGSYQFYFKSEDGTQREESGVLHNRGQPNEYLEVNGAYSYLDKEGKTVQVHYVADNHGFVPEGNNISPLISMNAKLVSQLPELVRVPVPVSNE